MGTKARGLSSFIDEGMDGFVHKTATSFLKKHQQPDTLLAQLKDLLAHGQLQSCRDLIQLIIREDHVLADDGRTYLLRAQVAFEECEDFVEFLAWIQQAHRLKRVEPDFTEWDQLVRALLDLKEGDYFSGKQSLRNLLHKESVRHLAQYALAHHLFWKNEDLTQALSLTEALCLERPGFVKAWSLLGFICNRMGLKVRAQEAFSHCLKHETNPDKIQFYRQQLAS